MTCQAFSAYRALVEKLSRVELKNTPFPMLLKASEGLRYGSDEGEPIVDVFMAVRDRDTGKSTTGRYSARVPLELLKSSNDDLFFDWLRRVVIREAIYHEVDEAIHVDGKRRFDPHKEGT